MLTGNLDHGHIEKKGSLQEKKIDSRSKPGIAEVVCCGLSCARAGKYMVGIAPGIHKKFYQSEGSAEKFGEKTFLLEAIQNTVFRGSGPWVSEGGFEKLK